MAALQVGRSGVADDWRLARPKLVEKGVADEKRQPYECQQHPKPPPARSSETRRPAPVPAAETTGTGRRACMKHYPAKSVV